MNIVWIQTDEQTADSLGCYGNALSTSPNIDGLASRGTRFNNHHAQSPVCVPSRTSELCGRYPHQTGVLTNGVAYDRGVWPEGLTSFPQRLASAGYQTANFGKVHTPRNNTWQTQWHFESFACCWYNEYRPGWDESDYQVMHLGHADKGVIVSGIHPPMPHGRTTQSIVVERGLEWLRQRDESRPFLLRCSFLAPHTPVVPDRRFYEMYGPEDVTFERPSDAELASRPRFEVGDVMDALAAHSDAEVRRMRASYLALVRAVDEAVGQLLAGLDAMGLTEQTLVIYSSDHGNLIGEHGRFQKAVFYDATTRVPLILAGPGVEAGATVDELTEVVDLAPTLMRLSGQPVDPALAGRDLIEPAEPRENVIGEVYGKRVRRAWIRNHRWSMDWTIGDDGEPLADPAAKDGKLNDLREDPAQTVNRYSDATCCAVIDELEATFYQRTSEGRRPIQQPLNG